MKRFVLDTIGFVCWALAAATLWSWFVVPLGVPSLTFASAAGLRVVWLFVFTERQPHSPRDVLPLHAVEDWMPYLVLFAAGVGIRLAQLTFGAP